ncbi:hypothetical protein C5167_035554 [Papaver somniferum]|uniref:Uncharacterized protein n=1 Tax=Papaver somniferum TaxID=3469 RepID=A0A4Y7KKC3_PAPSO|nr:hypothetical protein C5167_035554 [Papaver somniferum]
MEKEVAMTKMEVDAVGDEFQVRFLVQCSSEHKMGAEMDLCVVVVVVGVGRWMQVYG